MLRDRRGLGLGLGVGMGTFPSATVDADAQAFFNRVTAAGGTLTTTEKNATNQLVLDLKSAGIWTGLKAVYPMVGASAAACAQNLKSSSFTGTFSSGWTFASTGVTGNGTSAYMETNLNVNTELGLNSAHISTYNRTNSDGAYCEIGASAISTDEINIFSKLSNIFYPRINNQNLGTASTSSLGLHISNRISSTEIRASKNGAVSVISNNSNTKVNRTLWIGGYNFAGINIYFSNRQICFNSIGDGLTDTQQLNLYNAVETFNRALSRSVGPQLVSDADAQAYINRVYAAGGTLTNTEATAVNQLTIDMKAANVWTAMKAVYPMIGSSAAACSQNLKSSSFTGTFSSGWTFASTGVTPNGTSAFMNTALNGTQLNVNSQSLSYYSRTNNQGSIDIGIQISTQRNSLSLLRTYGGTPDICVSDLQNAGIGDAATNSINNSTGLYIASRTSATSNKLYRTGAVIATNTANWLAVSSLDLNFYIGASNTNGSPAGYSAHECAFSSIGDGLTDTQASNLYTAVQIFNQSLNRQVGAPIVSDSDAQAYINRVYTAGGTLTNTEATAVNQLTIDMKSAGIWSSMKAIYPMVGASASACAQNLKSSSFTGTFSSGWTFASTGVTPNGISAYMSTGFVPSTNLTATSQSSSIYSRSNTNNGAGLNADFSGVSTGIGAFVINVGANIAGINAFTRYGIAQDVRNLLTQRKDGYFIGSRTSSTLIKLYRNNIILGTTTIAETGICNIAPFIAAENTNGTATGFSNREYAFAHAGDGLNDTQASNLYTAVQTFNTTLGRQV
jgi:hypothetical protein